MLTVVRDNRDLPRKEQSLGRRFFLLKNCRSDLKSCDTDIIRDVFELCGRHLLFIYLTIRDRDYMKDLSLGFLFTVLDCGRDAGQE
jgi:hypothetical protein